MNTKTEPVVVVNAIDDGFRVEIVGLVQTNADQLDQELQRVAEGRPERVQLDLSGTNFISTVGLAILIAFRNRVVKSGGVVEVVAIQKQLLSVFHFTHLHKLFEMGAGTVIIEPEECK